MTTTANLTFNTLAEEFLRQYRSPARRTVEEFAAEFPEMSEMILNEFPALILAEQFKETAEESEETIEVPQNIGRYEVKGLIGRGGMGYVFAAKHPDLDTDVAVKVLPFDRLRSLSALKRFHIEARACASMDHPNIVPVYDHGTSDDFAYLVMRRVRGVSLDRIVEGLSKEQSKHQSKPMSLDWNYIASIGAQVAAALTYAHEQGIIHRDIKPANLLLETDGKVWVTDFGLAKLLQSDNKLSTTGDIVGTPKYMAPEQLRGMCDARTDLYSLGLTLYELATGHAIWQSATSKQLITQRLSLELPDLRDLNPSIPEALRAIIMKLCALQPENRYQSAKELSHVLNRYIHGNPVADRRRNGARNKWRRKTLVLWMIAGLFGTASVATGTYAILTRPENPYQDPESMLQVLDDEKVRERFVKELPGLFEQMVVNDDPRFRSAVSSLTQDAIQATIDEFPIAPEDKAKLEKEVNGWVGKYNKGELTNMQFGNILHRMATSPVTAVIRFKQVEKFIKQSGFSRTVKLEADHLMLRLNWGLVNEMVKNAEIGYLVDELNKFAPEIVVGAPLEARVSDEQLRNFLKKVNTIVERANVPRNVDSLKPADNIKRTVEQALKDPVIEDLFQKHSVTEEHRQRLERMMREQLKKKSSGESTSQ